MSTSAARRWWLLIGDRPDGPRTAPYIQAALQAGQLTLHSQACLEGETEWRPLSSWPDFSSLAQRHDDRLPLGEFVPRTVPQTVPGNQLVTNSRLPPMANLICCLTIVGLPCYWLFSTAVTLIGLGSPGGEQIINLFELFVAAPLSLGLTILMALGGMNLRDLKASGPRLIRLGIWLVLAFVALQLVVVLLLAVAIAAAGQFEDNSQASANAGLEAINILLGFTAFVLEIVSLIWLLKHGNELPLDRNR